LQLAIEGLAPGSIARQPDPKTITLGERSLIGLKVARFFIGTKFQNGGNYTKLPLNIPNGNKIYQNGGKIPK
jgi:hypothetical protein